MSRALSEAGRAYGNVLLQGLNRASLTAGERHDTHPALMWARSGLMHLTGRSRDLPQVMPAFLPACAEGTIAALENISGKRLAAITDPPALLGERAALENLARNGGSTAGGGGRFLRAADGWVIFNLPRADDWSLVAAVFTQDGPADWDALAAACAAGGVAELVRRAREVGIAAAPCRTPRGMVPPWFERIAEAPPAAPPSRRPRVIDLSSLWAGPLSASMLGMLDADVIKVESATRRDGMDQGSPALFRLLNADKEILVLDLADASGCDRLRGLMADADIVIESARPRGLRQMGIEAERILLDRPGMVWLSITAYGRGEPEGNWIGFGDDTAVAAGYSALLPHDTDGPILCADAIADPLAGLHAALAAWDAWITGRGGLISVSLHGVAAHCIGFRLAEGAALRARRASWVGVLTETMETAAAPRARSELADGGKVGRTRRR
jgi:crotonobetainyl-CoA:carnitine CoA-transferase CaiB-like acyl-CoA transferase